MDCALEVTNLVKRFETGTEPVEALRGVSLTVAKGEFVAILGPSGSGKSTLLHLVAGLDRPTAGSIRVAGLELFGLGDRDRTLFRRKHIGIIFQAYNLIPTLTAQENVALPALFGGEDGAAVQERAAALLELVDLTSRRAHRPQALSGGEQQRVAIARAMMNTPALMLCDEPTGNLDTQHGEEIWRLMASVAHEQGRAVVAVTHETTGAAFADRIVVLRDGRIAGEFESGASGDATLVAARYAELAK